MDFAEAVRLVQKSMDKPKELTGEEAMKLNQANSILAVEYIKVSLRIMPY